MKILAIGDITSPRGVEHLSARLWKFRERQGIDLCIANGENASFITGISAPLAEKLLRSGVDCITGGNHTLQNRQAYGLLDECGEILRPINYGDSAPGRGAALIDACGRRALIISAMGCVHIEPTLDSPYPYIDKALAEYRGRYDFAIIDFHAEATGEKVALGRAYDGEVSIVFGTHTHVMTADAQILPRGTGYITDIGMCGESGGVLGMSCDTVISRMRTRLPHRFTPAEGECVADGVIFTLDDTSYRVVKIEPVHF